MKEQLRTILSMTTGLPKSSITDEAILTRDLGLDSLDMVDLILQMEDRFKVSIPDQDYPKLQSLELINDYLQARMVTAA